jgi:hypothetical protein
MTLSQAIRLAAENGCEIEPAGDGKRVLIRAIAYDADPFELDESRIYAMSEDEFLREWLPPRYSV